MLWLVPPQYRQIHTKTAKSDQLNPSASGQEERSVDRLCNGQTLLCKSLSLKVPEWDGLQLNPLKFRILKNNDSITSEIIQTTRLGVLYNRGGKYIKILAGN